MGRTSSQNVLFYGKSSDEDSADIPGRGIAIKLLHHLRIYGLSATDEDNWRDCGWSFEVHLAGVALQVALAQTGEVNQWIAQIVTLGEPGMLAQLFGRKFIDHAFEVLAVSRSIDQALRKEGYTGILWRIDGFPETTNSTPEPIAPDINLAK